MACANAQYVPVLGDVPAAAQPQSMPMVCVQMLLQIQHDLGLIPESAAAAEAHAIKLLKLYEHSLSLCKGLDPKEKAPGDDLIPLAVASLMAARHLDMAGRHLDMAGSTDPASSASAGVCDRIVQKRMIQVTTYRPVKAGWHMQPIGCFWVRHHRNEN